MRGWLQGARLAALALLGGAWVVVPVARAEAPHEVATFFEVEFDNPHAWKCQTRQTCLTCKNNTSSDSNVIVLHTPDAHEDTHAVAAGDEVRICGDVIFIPHHD